MEYNNRADAVKTVREGDIMEQTFTYHTFISQMGNSQSVRIPKIFLEREQLEFSSDGKMPVELISTGKGILIKPRSQTQRITLEELFADWDGEPYEMTDELRAWEQMSPVGSEVL
jgi:antitoxin component of MazEF toxin-antitoxin module